MPRQPKQAVVEGELGDALVVIRTLLSLYADRRVLSYKFTHRKGKVSITVEPTAAVEHPLEALNNAPEMRGKLKTIERVNPK